MKIKQLLTTCLIFNLMLVMFIVTGWQTPVAQAGNGLPDRDPPPTQEDDGDHNNPAGAIIELVAPSHPGAWSVVQWQDSNGDWQDVDGWRGSLAARWMRPGAGPFGWVVGDSAAPTAASELFDLPSTGASTLLVTLTDE